MLVMISATLTTMDMDTVTDIIIIVGKLVMKPTTPMMQKKSQMKKNAENTVLHPIKIKITIKPKIKMVKTMKKTSLSKKSAKFDAPGLLFHVE